MNYAFIVCLSHVQLRIKQIFAVVFEARSYHNCFQNTLSILKHLLSFMGRRTLKALIVVLDDKVLHPVEKFFSTEGVSC